MSIYTESFADSYADSVALGVGNMLGAGLAIPNT